jgi:hypothetical protein
MAEIDIGDTIADTTPNQGRYFSYRPKRERRIKTSAIRICFAMAIMFFFYTKKAQLTSPHFDISTRRPLKDAFTIMRLTKKRLAYMSFGLSQKLHKNIAAPLNVSIIDASK